MPQTATGYIIWTKHNMQFSLMIKHLEEDINKTLLDISVSTSVIPG